MSENNTSSCDSLLTLLGQQLTYQNQKCEIIELLDGCELVLQALDDESNIQATQYGEGHRAVPATYVLSVFDGDGNLNRELIAAGLDDLLVSVSKNEPS